MRLDCAVKVSEMIASRVDFLGVGVVINSERETYDEFQARHVPEDEVLVTFQIPYEGVCMPTFYGQIHKTLCEMPKVITQEVVEEKVVEKAQKVEMRRRFNILTLLKLEKVKSDSAVYI